MGGKARLRKWLISFFPKSGNKYIEPFSGVANVFFQAKKELNFKEWHLFDINIFFLDALLNANLDELPDRVSSKEDFNYWKNANNYISKLIEPRCTFAGKGFASGADLGDKSHPPYNKKFYLPLCIEARRLLSDASIKQCSWDDINYLEFTNDDFVYFDPPYYETKACYPNINHNKLIETLNNAHFKWAISGYDNPLYNSLKYIKKEEKIRNSEIKGANLGKYSPVKECLWLNYD